MKYFLSIPPNILIELGFLDYVAYRKKKGKTKLFELTYGEDNGYGEDVGGIAGKSTGT